VIGKIKLGTFWVYYTDTVGCANTDSTAITVHICAGVTAISKSGQIKVLPNPNNGLFEIRVPHTREVTMARLYDAVGKQVWSDKVRTSVLSVDIRQQPEGMYYLKLQTAQGTEIYKLVKR